MDKLVISVTKTKNDTPWKPLMIPSDLYDQVETMAEQVGMRKGYLAIELLNFALERVEIKEED